MAVLERAAAIPPVHEPFAELKPPLTAAEALRDAERCLSCFDAPCTRACPTHIDVPGFIKRIAHGNLRGAARVILDANPLGASCARVCPTEVLCEGACVLHDRDREPIDIGRLQRYATDHAMADGWFPFAAGAPRPGRVAVVGAGPAGLACAFELRRRGREVEVFEAAAVPGGLNTWGVADYKMTAGDSLAEIAWIDRVGLKVHYGRAAGTPDLPFERLAADFDAVFLGVGLGEGQPLGVPGEDLRGVVDALDFIADLKMRPERRVSPGRRVVVVGGGNTSIDAVTQSRRLGAERVTLLYRRGPDEMPAYDHEVELARLDGVEVRCHAQVVRIEGEGAVSAVVVARTEPDPARAGAVRPVPGTEERIPCDAVMRAVGQRKRADLLLQVPGLALDAAGRVEVDPETFRTGNPRFYAGGDCVNGGQEVVNAVAHGVVAARAIDRALPGGAG